MLDGWRPDGGDGGGHERNALLQDGHHWNICEGLLAAALSIEAAARRRGQSVQRRDQSVLGRRVVGEEAGMGCGAPGRG